MTAPTDYFNEGKLREVEAQRDRLAAAVRNARDNSWKVTRPDDMTCQCEDWIGCTVLDPKDADELFALVKPHPYPREEK